MVTICQMCGDKGISKALVYCDECQEYAVHRYCLDTFPASFDEYVVWLCYDCELKAAKSFSIDKSHSPLLGESDHQSLKGVKVKRENCAKRLKKKSMEKVIDCSLHNSGFQRPHSSSSSSQLHEVRCSNIAEKNLQPGQESRLAEGGGSLEVVEHIETSKHSQLAFSDNHLPELDCCKNGEEDQNHKAVDRMNSDSLHNVAETLETKSSLLVIYAQPNGTKTPVDDDKDPCLAIQNNSEEPSFGENDNEALSPEDSKLTVYDLQPLRPYSLEDGEKALKPGSKRPLDKSLYDEKGEYQSENSQLVISATLDAPEPVPYVHAQPTKDPVWRGGMNIFKQKFGTDGGLAAHLSRIACPQVCKEANSLPIMLSPELLPRLSVWPKSFQERGPRFENIGLYLFPDNERNEKVFDCLVNDMISQDLAMRVVTENAELLIFSSKTLPLELWRFQMKFYLWGVFKRKQSLGMEDESGIHTVIC